MRKSFNVLTIKVIGVGVAFLLHVFLANLISIEHYGIYSYAINILNLLVIVSVFGLDQSSIRFISKYKIDNDYRRLSGVMIYNTAVVVISSIVIVAICYFIIKYFKGYFSGQLSQALLLIIFIVPIFSLIKIYSTTLLSLKETERSIIMLSILRPTGVMLAILLLYLFEYESIDLLMIIKSELLVFFGVWIIAMIWTYKSLEVKSKIDSLKKPVFECRQWISSALPLLVVAGGSVILHRADIIMLGAMISMEEVALYSAASKISMLLLFTIAAVSSVISPYISELYHSGKVVELQSLLTRSSRGVFIVTVFISIALAIWGETVLRIFGDQFIAAYSPLLILIMGQLFSVYFGFATITIYLTGHEKIAGKIMIAYVMGNILLNYFLINLFGMNGAAASTSISTILWNLILTIYLRKKININSAII
jgi:O-antigen/teichoic acid export membrane protein